jgi:hypothetical protein
VWGAGRCLAAVQRRRGNVPLLALTNRRSLPRSYGRAIGCFYLVFVELEAALKQAMDADPRMWARWMGPAPAAPGRLGSLPTCGAAAAAAAAPPSFHG